MNIIIQINQNSITLYVSPENFLFCFSIFFYYQNTTKSIYVFQYIFLLIRTLQKLIHHIKSLLPKIHRKIPSKTYIAKRKKGPGSVARPVLYTCRSTTGVDEPHRQVTPSHRKHSEVRNSTGREAIFQILIEAPFEYIGV